jgi:ATP-dependent DNA helicase RecG
MSYHTRIEVSDNAFKITLPNTNDNEREESTDRDVYSDDERLIFHYLKDNHLGARKQIEAYSGFSQAGTIRLLNGLINKGVILKEGQGKNTIYSIGGDIKRRQDSKLPSR